MRARHAKPQPALRVTAGFGLAMLAVVGWSHAAGATAPLPTTAPEPDSVLAASGAAALPPAVTESLEVQPATRRPAAGPAAAPAVVLPAGGITPIGIPRPVLVAYELAEAREAQQAPGCHLTWPVLAGIGLVESGHGVHHGALSRGWDGIAKPAILGPVLDGHGTAVIRDSDGGRLDGDKRWDRAVGPMQFLPATWRTWGVDADGNGVADPQDIRDASAATAAYLCADGRDLAQATDLVAAVFSYNHSDDYVRVVLSAARTYAAHPVPTIDAALLGLGAAPQAPTPPAPSTSPVPAPQVRPTTRTSPAGTRPAATSTSSPTPSAASPTPSASPTASSTGEPAPEPSAPSPEAGTP